MEVTKPNGFYYWIAKEFLKQAHSKKFASSFYSFELRRKGNFMIVECGNGDGFIDIKVYENSISRSGNYRKHRFVKKEEILSKANQLFRENNIPKYYEIRFQANISTNIRCVDNIEKGKLDVIRQWNLCHTISPISEPINWIIKEV